MAKTVDPKLSAAIQHFMKNLLDGMRKRGNTSETVVVDYGPRWAKICGASMSPKFKGRRAMYFVDLKPGVTYGFLHEAESWARPRRWHMGDIRNKV